jgi:lipid-A-disaccharide synthase
VNIAILSGEMSGDNAGAGLARALRQREPGCSLWGMGSARMAEAGVELLFDTAAWGAIGVVEALRIYPKIRFTCYPAVLREIDRRRPDVVVLIDFGAFNSKVARHCKAKGIRVLWYFPPGSWRREGRANSEIAAITDAVATPFPWSEERYRAMGANVQFVGHPLLDTAKPSRPKTVWCDRWGLDPGRPIIGLLPGSRTFEVEHNTTAMLDAARSISKQLPNSQFVIAAAGSGVRMRIENILSRYQHEQRVKTTKQKPPRDTAAHRQPAMITNEGFLVDGEKLESAFRDRLEEQAHAEEGLPPVLLLENQTYDTIAHSDAILVCSGTATLEAAILGTPMVVLYRMSRLMAMEGRLRRLDRLPYIGMPNIIAQRTIVPERIQDAATPQQLAQDVLPMITDPAVRGRILQDLKTVRDALGTPGAADRTAAMVLQLAAGKPQETHA